MSEPKPNKLGLAVLLLVVALLIGGANAWKTNLRVRRVEVQGTRLVQKNEVLQLADVAPKALLYAVDLSTVQRNVMSHYYVKDVSIERDLPSTLRLTVRERMPVAIINREEAVYLDADGVVLPRSIAKTLFDLPIINGIPGSLSLPYGSRIQDAGAREALRILMALKVLNREVYHNISEVRVVSNGDIVMFTADRGIPVLFGRGDAATKLVLLESFWTNVVRERGSQDLQYIDLRYENQVVVRWNEEEKTRM